MSVIGRILRDPLVHFIALGALVAGVFYATRPPAAAAEERRIVVTDADVNWLTTVFEKKWQRPPTEGEVRALVETYLREEIFYREAVALGLDRGDEVIRRSLARKIEFLAKDLGTAVEPTDAELRAFLAEDPARYEIGAQRSFSHVYFSDDRRGAQAEADANALLAELREATEPPPRAAERGDRFLLGYDMPLVPRREVARQYGAAFADRVFELDLASWQGPVRSGYGLHLVRVHEEKPARMPSLEEVADRVRTDLLEKRRRQVIEDFYRQLRDRYEIEYRAGTLAEDESGR